MTINAHASRSRRTHTALAAGFGLLLASAAFHQASAGSLPAYEHLALLSDDGGPGAASDADRTVRIEASEMAFNLKEIKVRAGETVRFVITNVGEIPHEFVIAGTKAHLAHREEMAEMSGMTEMTRPDPNAVMVEPHETKELVWRFGRATDLEFACDIPGHAESGMTGVFRVLM